MSSDDASSTPKQNKPLPSIHSPFTPSAEVVNSPRAAPPATVRPTPVDRPLKDISVFTKGSFATTGKIVRAHEKAMTTTGSNTPYFFCVIQDGVRAYSHTIAGAVHDACNSHTARFVQGRSVATTSAENRGSHQDRHTSPSH